MVCGWCRRIGSKKGNADIAIGNIVGSNIFNILFILGIASCITPIAFERVFVIDSLIAILAGCLLWFCVVRTKTLGKKGGIVMLAVYAAYLCYLL